MNRFAIAVLIATIGLAACAPVATITPEERIAKMPFDDAFRTVITAINSQPYPEDLGGWIIKSSDQVGGFISAEINGTRYSFWVGTMRIYGAVSVSLVSRPDGTTAVNISSNNNDEAKKLVTSITRALNLN